MTTLTNTSGSFLSRFPAELLRRVRVGKPIFWLLVAFVIVGTLYGVVTPLFETPDELWHYPMVKTLADGNGLPVQDLANLGPWQQEGSQPPLYYALMALATWWIDTSDMDQVRWLNPQVDNGVISEDGNSNLVVHTERETWPWRGTVLAIRLIRWLSVWLGVGTVYFTYRLVLEIAPEQPDLALAAASFTAFTPMFLFVSASVNNDSLVTCCSTLILWRLARWLRGPLPKLGWAHVGLGVLLGAGALSKQSALGLLPLAVVVLLAAQVKPVVTRWPSSIREWAQPARRIWGEIFPQGLVVFGVALMVCGWWYWRNYELYGDWLGWNRFVAIMGQRPHPPTLQQLWGERDGFIKAYWGLFGHFSVPMPDWTYGALNAGAGLAAVGLGVGLARALAGRRVSFMNIVVWALPIVWLIEIFVGLIRWTSLTMASQGRLVFPAIAAIGMLSVFGLAAIGRRLPWIMIAFLAGLSVAAPVTIIGPHYAPPPALTAEVMAAIPHRVDANFGGEMQLLGYALDTAAVQPGNPVRLTLYWQSLIAMDRNWSVFVHIVDAEGIIIGQRDRYPGRGALATTLLKPGQTFADPYVLQVPAGTYAPTEARIVVGLYDLTTGERLPLVSGKATIEFGQVEIQGRPEPVPNALRQNLGNVIELTGYTVNRRSLHAGEALRLELYWQALQPVRENYAVFTRVRDAQGREWVKQDAWPQQGAMPTVQWRVGEIVTDTYQLDLPLDTPIGTYEVLVGMYAADTLQRLLLVTPEGRFTETELVALSKIQVLQP